jgi:hypothetical protein
MMDAEATIPREVCERLLEAVDSLAGFASPCARGVSIGCTSTTGFISRLLMPGDKPKEIDHAHRHTDSARNRFPRRDDRNRLPPAHPLADIRRSRQRATKEIVMKWILALALFSGVAGAQQVWDYSDGNALFDSTITLASALPQNGTVDVSPTSMNIAGIWGFTVPSIGFLSEAPGGAPTFQLTMTNGQITAFDMGFGFTTQGTNSPTTYDVTISSQGDSYFQQTNGFQCESGPPACAAIVATSAPGSWADPPAHAAPELDASRAGLAMTLFAGLVLVLKARRP